jgi:lipoprotein-releasing system ATP-binding protein
MQMIEAKNISKSYGSVKVLNNVNFYVDKAAIVSIVGKSGAGKSTLLHILGTLEKADAGELYIDGIEVSKYTEKKLAKFRNEHIGFIFQFHHLLDEFTALENVCMPALIKGESKDAAEKKAKELLDYLGLSSRMTHKPAEMSGGEQQRVAAARALINKPAVIFADEPSGNLDNNNSTEMHALFQKMSNDFNQTFIIVTHNNELAQLSDATYEMTNGQLTKK